MIISFANLSGEPPPPFLSPPPAAPARPSPMPPKKSDIPFPKPAKNCVPPPSVLFLTPEPLLFLGFFVPPVSIFGVDFGADVLFLPPGSFFSPICPPVLAYTTLLTNIGRLVPPPMAFMLAMVSEPNLLTAPLLITNSPGANMAGMVSLFGPLPGTLPPSFI